MGTYSVATESLKNQQHYIGRFVCRIVMLGDKQDRKTAAWLTSIV